jgi:hypothetical protein
MTVQATTVSHIIWNVESHTGIIAIIFQGVYMECILDLNRVLSDPAMQTVVGRAMPIFESGRGEGISTAIFSILNENEIMIWKAGESPFCNHSLEPGK